MQFLKKAILIVGVISITVFTTTPVFAKGPDKDNGKGKGKGKGQKTHQTDNAIGTNGNGNTGNSKTRKGVDDTRMNQNIYTTGDTLSYHVAKINPDDDYTVIVKKPGKNGEVVFNQDVIVNANGTLNLDLTTIPDNWSGVYQVQIWGTDNHMKNDNINIRQHIINHDSIPTPNTLTLLPPNFTAHKEPGNDCVTIIFHHSGTVVEFFQWDHRFEPWQHESEILGESNVKEGVVSAQIAQGENVAVFDYNETNGQYTYLGQITVIGSYEKPIDLWNDGDSASTPYNAIIWIPESAGGL